MVESLDLDNIINKTAAGVKDPAAAVKRTRAKNDPDPLGYIEFAKNVGPAKAVYSEPEYEPDDKGFESEVDFAKAGRPEGETKKASEADPLKEIKDKLQMATDDYSKTYGQARAQRKWFQKILDVNVEKKNTEVIAARQKYLEARENYIRESIKNFREKFNSQSGIDPKLAEAEIKNFSDELLGEELCKLQADKNDKAIQYNVDRGFFAKRVADPYMRMSRWISKRHWTIQVGFYGALLAAGSLSAIYGIPALAAASLAVGTTARIARAGAAGEGARGLSQSAAQWYRKWKGRSDADTAQLIIERNNSPEERISKMEERLEHLEGFLLRENGKLDGRLRRREGADKWRRRLGVFTGVFVGSGALGYILSGTGISAGIRDKIFGHHGTPSTGTPKAVGGGPPMVEGGKGGPGLPAGEAATGAELHPHGPGMAAVPEKVPFHGGTHTIKSGENVWKAARDVFARNAEHYGYNEEQTHKLFNSFRNQGVLRRLGIKGIHNFSDLNIDQKHLIFAEGKTATMMPHGITDLVHANDVVNVDAQGHIMLNPESGIKPGYLHHAGHGAAAAEHHGSGRGVGADTSQFDQQIEAARHGGVLATERQQFARSGAAAAAAESDYIKSFDPSRTSRLMRNIFGGDYSTVRARDFVDKMKYPVQTDGTALPYSDIQTNNMRSKLVDKLVEKYGQPSGNVQNWLINRVSPEDLTLLRRVSQ